MPSQRDKTQFFSNQKAGFGKADRFLYRKMQERNEGCGINLGPATYDQLDSFKSVNKLPFYTLIKKPDIPVKDVKHYKYSGNMLVFDPKPQQMPAYRYEPKTRQLVKGTRGIMCHPNLQTT